MQNKIIWVGTKESDILHTNKFFSNSITACGSGKAGNFSFSVARNIRTNYNVDNPEYTEYLIKKMENIVAAEPMAQFMYYNPYYAHLLVPSLSSHVCCLNSKPIMNLLRSKCEMRAFASKYVSIVPFERILGQELKMALSSNIKATEKKYIIQKNISSGGEGTYIISKTNKIPYFPKNAVYLLAPYYEKNIPINVNFIIFDDDIIIFPASIQIIQQLNGKLLFTGTDYHTEKYHTYLKQDVIFQNTLKLASALKELGYRGIGGFDYIYAENELLFLECNPRFQASTYLLNLSLEKQNLPSVQELNFMAFEHKNAPNFEFYKMKVPYSCVAHSYQKYLKNSLIRKEWYTHPNVIEILEDGFNSDMEFADNAYLYRVIFSKSITAITPEMDLISYDNLLPASQTWYDKIVSGNRLALKIGLLNQGIYISKNVLNFIKQKGGLKGSVFDSIDIILKNSMVVNCPYDINYAVFSPFSLNLEENQLKLYYYQESIEVISLEPTNPDEERLTQINHIPYRRLSYVGGDRLRIHHTDICIFKHGKNNCRFCNLPVSGFEYTIEDIYEVIDFYLQKGIFRHILIGGGSEPIEYESDTVLRLVKYIRHKTDMPIYLMCLPIKDKVKLRELYCAGVNEIGFNIEIWDDETAKKIMPGKGKISRNEYLTALKNAKEIWKETYAVRSLLIVGLETQATLKEAVEILVTENIMPILSVFRPLPDSQMVDFLPPTNDYLYTLYEQLDYICQKYNQHLGPDCKVCQNNTLSLPW